MERWCEVETEKASDMQRLCRWHTLGVRWQAWIKRPYQRLAAPQSEFWLIGLSSLSDRGYFTQHSGEPYPCPFHSTPCQKKGNEKRKKRIYGLWVFADKIRIPLPSPLMFAVSLSLSIFQNDPASAFHSPCWGVYSNVSLCMCIGKQGTFNQQTPQHEAFREQVSVPVMCVCTSV